MAKDHLVICRSKLIIEANTCLFRKNILDKDMFRLWFMNAKGYKHTRNKFKQKQTTALKRPDFYNVTVVNKVYPKVLQNYQ